MTDISGAQSTQHNGPHTRNFGLKPIVFGTLKVHVGPNTYQNIVSEFKTLRSDVSGPSGSYSFLPGKSSGVLLYTECKVPGGTTTVSHHMQLCSRNRPEKERYGYYKRCCIMVFMSINHGQYHFCA